MKITGTQIGKPELDLFMKTALGLARKGFGRTSPNPMVGALVVKNSRIIGRGWHRGAGQPHAEIEALSDALKSGEDPAGATLFVTLEPCSTFGRTPPCTESIYNAGIKVVVVGAIDPNPIHKGRGLKLLQSRGIRVISGVFEPECVQLNEVFNHWIVKKLPFVAVKSALSLDGKIATASGESKWITGEKSRRFAMELRRGHDAILVGVKTILCDNPSLTVRVNGRELSRLRLVIDPAAKLSDHLESRVISDRFSNQTIILVSPDAPSARIKKLNSLVRIQAVPQLDGNLSIGLILKFLTSESITSLLVEGGGETTARFLEAGAVQRACFFFAPKVIGGEGAPRAVAGAGFNCLEEFPRLKEAVWRTLGNDLLLTGRI